MLGSGSGWWRHWWRHTEPPAPQVPSLSRAKQTIRSSSRSHLLGPRSAAAAAGESNGAGAGAAGEGDAEGGEEEEEEEEEDALEEEEEGPDVEAMSYEQLLALGEAAGHVSRGAPATVIQALPFSAVTAAMLGGQEQQCAVCRVARPPARPPPPQHAGSLTRGGAGAGAGV